MLNGHVQVFARFLDGVETHTGESVIHTRTQDRFKMSTLIGEDQKDVLVYLGAFLLFASSFQWSVDKSARAMKLIPLFVRFVGEDFQNVSGWWAQSRLEKHFWQNKANRTQERRK